jgi:chemotaxis protein MotA
MTFLIGLISLGFLFASQNTGWAPYFNSHGMILVFGGSVCVFLMVTPFQTLKHVWAFVKMLWKDEQNISSTELKSLLTTPNAQVPDPFGVVNLARDLWELGVSAQEYEDMLFAHAESCLNRDTAAIGAIRNLGKYPPALGMVGTVMGMIQLFGGLGGNTQQAQVGGQLALAMTSTFYGLILSNYILMPVADRMDTKKEMRRVNLEQTIRVLVSIQSKQPKFVTERLLDAS